jgi:hypothetical protein
VIDLSFDEALGICERLGRDASSHLNPLLIGSLTLSVGK